ncbi:MAG: hypothetical protein AAGD05_16685, partial [Bacteroidota bacterium]
EVSIGINSTIFAPAFELLGGGFDNTESGTVNIGSGQTGMIVNESQLTNEGNIKIDNAAEEAIKILSTGLLIKDGDLRIGKNTPTQEGILVEGTLTNNATGNIEVLTSASTGIEIINLFINRGLFITDGDLIGTSTATIRGNGAFELFGSWNNQGDANIATSTLILSDEGVPSSVTNTTEILSLNRLMINEGNSTATLQSSILVNDVLVFTEGTLDLNGNNISLTSSAILFGETEDNYIFDSEGAGNGYLERTQALNAPTQNTFGDIGVTISSDQDLGDVTIRRRHFNEINTNPIVNRTFEITYTNPSSEINLILSYFEHELGILDETSLSLFDVSANTFAPVSVVNSDATNNLFETEGLLSGTELAFAENSFATVWTGAISSDWHTAGNWSSNVVPNQAYSVIIPSVTTNDPIIENEAAFVKTILIDTDGSLTSRTTLTIEGAENDALIIFGAFSMETQSSLTIKDAGNNGISLSGTGVLQNNGTINLGINNNVGNNYIVNSGQVINDGNIIIDGTGEAPIWNTASGRFYNNSFILIGNDPNSDFDIAALISNEGIFENTASAELELVQHEETALFNA